MTQPFPCIFVALLATAAATTTPCFSQTPTKAAAEPPAKTAPAVPPAELSPQEKAMWKLVDTWRDVEAQFIKSKGAAYAVGVMYADEYVMVQPDGKETTKTELLKQIADGRAFQDTADVERQFQAEGGKTIVLPKEKQTWRPERYEAGDNDRVIVYTSPVQKKHQMLPFGKDGKLVDVEIKLLSTTKETFKRKLIMDKPHLFLERWETVGMKTYLNGKEQHAGFGTGTVPPKL